MKKFLSVLMICLLFVATASAAALDNATKKILDDEFSAMIGDSGGSKVPGLGVVVFKDGKRVYSFFGGRRHIDPDKPVKGDTLFRAASLSKMFTAFAIMQLVEQGKLNLNDDVSKYLGFELRNPNFPNVPITIEMLASHTSSLRDGDVYHLPPQYSLKEFFTVDGVAYEDGKHFAAEQPGKFFTYCNLNYGILGTVIERVTGERFDVYQREHVLKPMNIGGGYVVGNFSDETFQKLGTLYQKKRDGKWDESAPWAAQVDNYNFKPRKDTVRLPSIHDEDISVRYELSGYVVGTNATIFAPQSGLRVSFNDLSNCLEMLINRGTFNGRKILSPKSVDTILNSHWLYDEANPNGKTYGGVMENYGLGTYKLGSTSKARPCKDFAVDLVGHSGEAYGMIAGLYLVPNTRDGFVFMINGTALDVDDERAFGEYSVGYIWEEAVMNPVCKYIFAK